MSEVLSFTVGKDFLPSPRNTCDACRGPWHGGQRVYMTNYPATPWLPEGSEDHEWGAVAWHQTCDRRSDADAQGRPSTEETLGAVGSGDNRYGLCPQQVTGRDSSGRPFYFRERHGEWTLHRGEKHWPTDFVQWPASSTIIAEGNGSPDPDFIDGLITLHLGEGWTHG